MSTRVVGDNVFVSSAFQKYILIEAPKARFGCERLRGIVRLRAVIAIILLSRSTQILYIAKMRSETKEYTFLSLAICWPNGRHRADHLITQN